MMTKAKNGDTVKVRLFPKRGDRKLEGQVVEILNRKRRQFVGIIEKSGRRPQSRRSRGCNPLSPLPQTDHIPPHQHRLFIRQPIGTYRLQRIER